MGAGSTCINLSEERYKHIEWLIGLSGGSQEESTLLFIARKYLESTLCIHNTFDI